MTALSANRDSHQKPGNLIDYEMVASDTIYSGGIVCESSGYAAPGADTAGYIFMGISNEKQANESGSAGDKRVQVWAEGVFVLKFNGTPEITDVGSIAYVVDDQTVGTTSTNGVEIGRIVEVTTSSNSAPLSTVIGSDEVAVKIHGLALS